MVRRSLVVVFTVALVACGASEVPQAARPTATATASIAPTASPRTPVPSGTRLDDLAGQFTYDSSVPLGTTERGSALDGTLTVRDIEFTGAKVVAPART